MHLNFYKYIIQRVLSVSTLCFLLYPFNSNAQDSLSKKNYHVVGIGALVSNNIDKNDDNAKYTVNFSQPAASILYRHFFNHGSSKSITTANAYITYKNASIKTSSFSMGSRAIYQKGLIDLVRFDIGLSRLAVLGKRKGFQIGGGFGLGGLIYTSGTLDNIDYLGNVISSESIKKSGLLNRVNAYINFEMNQRIRVSQNSNILIGCKSQIGSSEGFRTQLGVSETLFVAYMFKV
jgi:hypothetical protein